MQTKRNNKGRGVNQQPHFHIHTRKQANNTQTPKHNTHTEHRSHPTWPPNCPLTPMGARREEPSATTTPLRWATTPAERNEAGGWGLLWNPLPTVRGEVMARPVS